MHATAHLLNVLALRRRSVISLQHSRILRSREQLRRSWKNTCSGVPTICRCAKCLITLLLRLILFTVWLNFMHPVHDLSIFWHLLWIALKLNATESTSLLSGSLWLNVSTGLCAAFCLVLFFWKKKKRRASLTEPDFTVCTWKNVNYSWDAFQFKVEVHAALAARQRHE